MIIYYLIRGWRASLTLGYSLSRLLAVKSSAIRPSVLATEKFLTNLMPRCKLLGAHSPTKFLTKSGGAL